MYNNAVVSLLPRAIGIVSGVLMAVEMEAEIDMDISPKGVIRCLTEAKDLMEQAHSLLIEEANKDTSTSE